MEAPGTSEYAGKVVPPGTDVLSLSNKAGQIELGPGLTDVAEHTTGGRVVRATTAGTLKQLDAKGGWKHRLVLHGSSKRYTPQVNDCVLGIVVDKLGETFSVNIKANARASLHMLAFEGATRRNRPSLSAGDAVLARVEFAAADMEATLTCVASNGKAEGYGPLKGGYVIEVSTGYARTLMGGDAAVLHELAKYLTFEVAVGRNGRVWIDGSTAKETVIVANAIAESALLSADDARVLAARLAGKYTQQQTHL